MRLVWQHRFRPLSALVMSVPLLATGCSPTLPAAQAPTPVTPPPSEFVQVYQVPAGTTLQYEQRIATSGSVPGETIPETQQVVATSYQVLSVDRQGTTTVRVDLEGKPLMLIRVRRNGTLRELRALSPEAQGTEEELKGFLAAMMKATPARRPLRVGDAVPLRMRVPMPKDTPEPFRDLELVGTLILSEFQPVGRCWGADFRGALRLETTGGAVEVTDPKSGRRFRVALTAEWRARHEVRTGAEIDSRFAFTVEVGEVGARSPALGRVTGTGERRLSADSLKALGCG